MLRAITIALLAFGFALPIGGCHGEGAVSRRNDSAPAAREDQPPLISVTPTLAGSESEDANSSLVENESKEELQNGTPLELPYPDRTEMFQEPAVGLVRPTEIDNPIEPTGGLELKGFVDVGEQKALVLWDGQVRTVQQGDLLGQIEVIEIAPPQIRLQRGRVRWIETVGTPSTNYLP